MTTHCSSSLFESSLLGITRGICVHTLVYPLEVTKIRYQCCPVSTSSLEVGKRIFQNEGFGAFYKGLPHKLVQTSLKQGWCWPMMAYIPSLLDTYRVKGRYNRQALTGIAIAFIDTTLFIPLEKAKITSACTGKNRFVLPHTESWRGSITLFGKLSVSWSTFLTSQQYLRDRYRKTQETPLDFSQLIQVGIGVAFFVSIASAPFDVANTKKQAQNLSIGDLFSTATWKTLYRGWPLSALGLVIHNIASMIVIEKLRI